MVGLRFETVRDLYEAFQTAENDVGMPASDQPSLAFLQSLIAQGGGTRPSRSAPTCCRDVKRYGGAANACGD